MPCYCFRTARGESVEVFMTMDEMSAARRKYGWYRLPDGRRVRRDFCAEQGHPQRGDHEHTSEALALDFDSKEDMKKQLASDRYYAGKNAPDGYKSDGRPYWRGDSMSARIRKREYCRALNFRKRDEFF